MNQSEDKAKISNSARSSVTIIRPAHGWVPVNLKEVWAYRELLYFFVWRDLKVRYRQTVVGFTWAIIQPVFTMVVFSLFFGTLAKIPSEGVPYPLFTFSALVPWNLFFSSVSRSSNSLVQEASLIQKIYIPRLLMPISGILSPLVDFCISFLVLIGMMFYFGYIPGVMMLWIIPFLVLELMLSTGMGLWLSAINVEYRDIGYAIPFLLQLLLFASPIIYSSNFIPARFQAAYGIINPVSGIIEGFRWAIIGTKPPSYLIVASVAIIIVILVTGAFYFRRRERVFADVA